MNPSPFSLLHMIVVMLLATADPTNGIAKDGPGATGSKARRAPLLRYSCSADMTLLLSIFVARWREDYSRGGTLRQDILQVLLSTYKSHDLS